MAKLSADSSRPPEPPKTPATDKAWAPYTLPPENGSTPRCSIQEVPEGLKVTFIISDRNTISRLKNKAYTRPLHRYLWEDIISRAINNAVF